MKTQKVRIKVLIAASGNYLGYGWRGASDNDPDDTLYDGIDELNTREYWLSAMLPIPGAEVQEVEAVIEEQSMIERENP